MADDLERQEPLSSKEMIERAKGGRSVSSEELIRQAKETVSEMPEVEGLEDISVDIPVADEFPEPVPQIQTRPRRVARREPTQFPEGPIYSDSGGRVAVIAVTVLILLVALGIFFAFVTSISANP